MRRHAVLGAVVLAAAACPDATSPRPINAPTRVNAAQGAAANDYIVVFKNDETDPAGGAEALTRAYGGSVRYVYATAIKGFAVANLPDQYRNALTRKYVDGESLETLASELGISVDATKSHLARARRAFRDTFATLSTHLSEVSQCRINAPPPRF